MTMRVDGHDRFQYGRVSVLDGTLLNYENATSHVIYGAVD